MASNYRITSRYAKALIDLAKERNQLAEIKKDADLVVATCDEVRALDVLFKNPIILPQKKLAVAEKVFKGKISDISFKFIEVIVRKNRSPLIFEVFQKLVEQYKTYNNQTDAVLVTASTASDALNKRVSDMVANATGKEIDLKNKVDEDLIGGFQIQFEGLMFDASVKSQLKKLEKQISQ
ncbi:MAG: ATP synthase F1 subunit delta [Bacteroidetes bacterium]|nr:ATP synthase F1 subunit delta [Bacteroidota bacterium]